MDIKYYIHNRLPCPTPSDENMAVSKKRKSTQKHAPPQRHSKGLFLPMLSSEADSMILGVRIALESIRQQRSGRAEAVAMVQALLLTTFLTETGHGALALSDLAAIEINLTNVLVKSTRTGDWRISDELVGALAVVVNEHDRQLHEVRLGAILDATHRVRHL